MPATHCLYDEIGAAILPETGNIRSLPDERARLFVPGPSVWKRSTADRAGEQEP